MSATRPSPAGPGIISPSQTSFVQSPMSSYFPDIERGSSASTMLSRGSTGWGAPKRRWMPRPDDPHGHPKRTLILCFDGTGDQFDNDNSNIVQLVALLKKDDPSRQMVYYQPGIGTYTNAGPGLRAVSKVMDLMIAWSLDNHVRDGYEFLMQNYSEGDKICIFGFSRGAYTALGLAGMLQKIGLLPPYNKQQLPFAYYMYSREDDEALALATEFKETFSTDVNVDFVGVWDTVCSVGFIPRYLPFTSGNTGIRYFRHALALDEHRAKFMPNFTKHWDEEEDDSDVNVSGADLANMQGLPGASDPMHDIPMAIPKNSTPATPSHRHKPHRESTKEEQFEEMINKAKGRKTDSLEVWFAGAHTDVGGGSVPNNTRHSLARIPLRWMIRECFKCNSGIIFDADMLKDKLGMDIDLDRQRPADPPKRLHPTNHDILPGPRLAPETELESFVIAAGKAVWYGATWPVRTLVSLASFVLPGHLAQHPKQHGHLIGQAAKDHQTTREPFKGEAVEELHDALSPAYDQLRIARGWWLLEWMPLKQKKGSAVFTSSNQAHNFRWMINRGDGRKVFKAVVRRGLKVHRSVLTRLEALTTEEQPRGYIPRIRPNIICDEGAPHERRICRTLTHEEWLEGAVENMPTRKPLFEWV